LDRFVVDRTNLTGTFDIKLRWTPFQAAQSGVQQDAPTLFSALQEQLGLKLEPREELIDVVVIDHIERPTPN
jgi:uncharacterized protein (TIGR03435 family)